jgi:hypothetical protein
VKAEPTLHRKTARLEHSTCRRLSTRGPLTAPRAVPGLRRKAGAIPPDLLARIIGDAILARLNLDADDRVLATAAARAELSKMLAGIGR